MSTLYERRVEQEWRLLEAIAKGNPDLLENPTRCVEVDSALFRFRLQQTQALIQTPTGLHLQDLHDVVIYFPRFFPSVPIEASLLKPVFHPNVHPETGFVCLWNRFSPGDTVVEAITQLQRVITWELWNEETDHLMQMAAIAWHNTNNKQFDLPLFAKSPLMPEGFDFARTYARPSESKVRKRLESK